MVGGVVWVFNQNSRAANKWSFLDRDYVKISIFTFLILLCTGIIFYSPYVLGARIVYTHLFYIPIALAGFWWGRKSIWVAFYFGACLLFSSFLFSIAGFYFDDLLRSIMFITVAWIICKLRERNLNYRETLSDIIKSNSIPTLVINKDHVITHFNKACEALTNFSRKKMIGSKNQWMPFFQDEKPILADLIIDGASEKTIIEHYQGKCNRSSFTEGGYEGEFLFPKLGENGRWLHIMAAPLKNTQGEVIGAIETFLDVTENKKAEKILKESEKYYRQLFEFLPDGVIVYCEDKVAFANTALSEILGVKYSEVLLGKSLNSFIHQDYLQRVQEQVKYTILEGKSSSLMHCKCIRIDGKVIDVEMALTPYEYKGKSALLAVVRDITERKRDLERAARMQRERLVTKFPLPNKADLEIIYIPVEAVSGDFIYLYKVDNNHIIGLLGDVSGKGVSAALSSSALKVLFFDVATEINEPLKILNYINQEVNRYLEDEHIAACCFSFDFQKQQLKIASAGINQFFFYQKDSSFIEEIIRGPSLGMLEEELFEQKMFNFQQGDKFYFYTDGLEEIFADSRIIEKFIQLQSPKEQKKYLESVLTGSYKLKDDSTWLVIKIK